MERLRFTDDDLPGDVERPPGEFWSLVTARPAATVLRISPDGQVVAARVAGPRGRAGVGIWERSTGKARWWHDWADNVRFLTSSPTFLTYEDGSVCRYSWPDVVMLDYVDADEYTEALVVSASERLVATFLNDGAGENGYELFGLDGPLHRLEAARFTTSDGMGAMPVFSPSERLVLCSPGAGDGWWSSSDEEDDEASDEASDRGPATFGSLIVYDIVSDARSEHELRFDLEPGWRPDDRDDPRWVYGPTDLAFLAEDRIRVTLPDESSVDLQLPLPAEVTLPSPRR